MERRGSVHAAREVGIRDRRTFVINTTMKARKVAARVYDHLRALEEAVGRRVTKEDVRGFLEVLNAVEDVAREASAKRNHR